MKRVVRSSFAALVITSSFALAACGSNNSGTASSAGSVDAKSASATSAADFGGMDGLVKAAKAEGSLNVIALPHDWANYGAVIDAFKAKYGITVNEQNPNASSKEEIDAINTNKGTDKAPDVVDVGAAVAEQYAAQFAPYKVAAYDAIPAGVKDAQARYYADYTGIMTIGYNKTKYGDITAFDQLADPKFKGTVALNGKPAEAGAAFNGFLMATIGNGGSITNLQPGLDYFKKLKAAGTLSTVDVTNATVDSGQTGVVFDWSYNQVSTKARLAKQGVDWEYKVIPGAEVASYYNQAINKDAPHPAAARLWQEFLYTPDAQNLWLKGGATPVLLDKMKADGTVDKTALAEAVQTSKAPLTYTQAEAKSVTAFLEANWDKAIGN